MSLHNLQNLHSTNWLRVLDAILYFCFNHLLRRVRELCLVFVGGNYRAWVVFRDFWAIPPRVSRNFLFQGLLTGGSGEVFVFLKVVLSVFYIIILSGT